MLLRALEPLQGVEEMMKFRNNPRPDKPEKQTTKVTLKIIIDIASLACSEVVVRINLSINNSFSQPLSSSSSIAPLFGFFMKLQ